MHRIKTGAALAVAILILGLGGSAEHASAQAALSVDAQARLLGGLPLSANEANHPTALAVQAAIARSGATTAGALFSANRSLFSPNTRLIMRNFFSSQLGAAGQGTRGVLYFFGGPDVVFPDVVFPNYERLLLVGLETPGRMPNPAALLQSGGLAGRVGQISRAFQNISSNSYFITSNMGTDLAEIGTTTMIAVGLVTMGNRLEAVEEISLDRNGGLYSGAGEVTGVRVAFVRPNGQRADVIYFRFDLSDGNMNARPHLRNFVAANPFDAAYYKAAMYAPHATGFNELNRMVTNKVNLIVQNDDGLPWRILREVAPRFSVRLYGQYTIPHSMFQVSPQAELRQAYSGAICASTVREAPAAQALLARVPGSGGCAHYNNFGFASLTWEGNVPFHYGYAAISGPKIVEWPQMYLLGNTMILNRVR